jgi:hypothetical protein
MTNEFSNKTDEELVKYIGNPGSLSKKAEAEAELHKRSKETQQIDQILQIRTFRIARITVIIGLISLAILLIQFVESHPSIVRFLGSLSRLGK